MAPTRILFVTKQDEIVKELEKTLLQGCFVDIAKKGAAAKHFLRGNTCDYDIVVIDENLADMTSGQLMQWVYNKHPTAHIAGISQNLSVWPEAPGRFTHIEKYFNHTNKSFAWKRDQLKALFAEIHA